MREPWQRPGSRGGAELAPRLAVLALVGLLAALAVLQWRWIGEVSHLERERQRASLGAAGERVASTLDREVLRAFFYFHAPPPGGTAPRERRIAERLDLWRRDAPWPELVRAVYTFDPAAGTLALAIPAEGRFRPVPWPAALAPARARIERGVRVPELEPRGPALLIPFDFAPRVRLAPASPGQVAVVLFDREVIARRILPGLVEREFSLSRAPELLVAVIGPDGLLYRSDPGLPAARYAGSDLRLPMFGLRETRDLHELMPFPGDRLHGFGHLGRDRQPADRPLRRFGPPSGAEGAWQIVVSHRAGSLEAAVAHARWHNFAISLGILALLAASLLVLARSAERARRLARQRLELVAGVTHELNTPLAAMRAAAQNLADGVVVDPARVKSYGAMIEREGTRLSSLVAQSLELAGIESGARAFRLEPTPVGLVVDEALGDVGFALERAGCSVERAVPPDLPPVAADRAALRLALRNLLENAAKHAAAGRSVSVRARAESDGRKVALRVEDRGPGVPAEDRPHLFEPFFRGRATASAKPGAGLGLALARRAAEAMGGTLTHAEREGGGSAFEILLPVAVAVVVEAGQPEAAGHAAAPAEPRPEPRGAEAG